MANAKVKKTILWGGLLAPMVLGVYFLFGGNTALAAGPHGHGRGGMGPRGGFDGGHMMNSAHHGFGFSWLGFLLFLIIAGAVFWFVVKWLKRKAKDSSMQQFIDTSLMNSYQPNMNQNGNVLDQWEKTITNKKENM